MDLYFIYFKAKFLTINSDGSLSTEERQSPPNAFFRLVNADGTNSFLSKNHKQQYIKSPNGCQNFNLRQEDGGYSNQFELVSACGNEEEERIELTDGKFHTFRLVDALIIHWIERRIILKSDKRRKESE